MYPCLVYVLFRKRAARDSEDEEASSDSGESEFHLESDSDPGEMPETDARELSPTEKLRKKREKPVTR